MVSGCYHKLCHCKILRKRLPNYSLVSPCITDLTFHGHILQPSSEDVHESSRPLHQCQAYSATLPQCHQGKEGNHDLATAIMLEVMCQLSIALYDHAYIGQCSAGKLAAGA